MSVTADFTHPCRDCGRTIRVRRGKARRHWCRVPRSLRGMRSRAHADGMRWACAQAGHPRQQPGDIACICETWARWVELGFLLVEGRQVRAMVRQMDAEPANRNAWEVAVRDAARSGRLARDDLTVALLLATYASWDGSAVRVGLRTVCETVGCSRSTALAIVERLLSTGWLARVTRGSGTRPSEYRLTTPSGTAQGDTANRSSGTALGGTATAAETASGTRIASSGTRSGASGTLQGSTEPMTLDLEGARATNGSTPPRTWSQAWAQLERYVRRHGPHDPDRPDPAHELDEHTLAVVQAIGGMGAVRRSEVNRWDFRDTWRAMKA